MTLNLALDDNQNAVDMPEIRRDSDLLRLVTELVRERLPRGWTVDLQPAPLAGGRRPDALLEITAPDGTNGATLVAAQLGLEPREAEPLVTMLERALDDTNLPVECKGPPLVVSRFISPRARDVLVDAGACYADVTGNLRITLERPALFIEGRGVDRNPWREERDLRSLRGRIAARVVRALCDLQPPFGVRDLAQRANASAGSTVRTLDLLSREALIARDQRKQVTEVDLGALIRRWADDFRFSERNAVRRCFEPRRLEETLERVASLMEPFAVTGSFAAASVAEYAESRLLAVYVGDLDSAQEVLEVRSARSQSNVWLVEPPDDLPFERTWRRDGLRYAALSQVACDLLTMPGRAPAEAEELLRWMEANPGAWRAD